MPNSDFDNLLQIVRRGRFEGVDEGSKKLVAVRRALLLHSISPGYFFGDMKRGKYFVSDYIRDFFGFDDNEIAHFPYVVTKRMCRVEDQMIHTEAIKYLLSKKATETRFSREWYFRVRDLQGNLVWIWASVDVFRSSIHPVMVTGSLRVLNTMALVYDASNYFAYGVMLRDLVALLNRFNGWNVGCYVLPNMSRNEGGNTSGQNFMRTTLSLALGSQKIDGMRFFRLKDNVGIVFSDPKLFPEGEAESAAAEVLEQTCERIGIAFGQQAGVSAMGCATGSALGGVMRNVVKYLRDRVEFDDRGIMGPGGFESLTFGELFILGDACFNDFSGFGIVIQPLVDKASRKLIGGEVLMRMSNAKTPLGPDKFVPIFENSRLMVPLGRHLVDLAMRLAKECIAIDPNFLMSINVSGAQMSDSNLLSFIEASLKVNDLSGRNFMIEITESYGVESEQVVTEFLHGCRRLGMCTAVDDFGEGYSSIRRLLSGEFSVVKLGAELSRSAMDQVSSREFLESVIAACRRFGVKVCVEGIEDSQMARLFDEMDCDIYQGYLFGKPMKSGEFLEFLAASWKEKAWGR
jgi:EAL domain-containing protein (putative c-di-GMP-specific phosphodiesterase class I)